MSNKLYPPNINQFPLSSSDWSEEEISYKELFRRYLLNRWYFYLIGLGLAYFAASTYLKYTPSTYSIEAKVLIKEKEKFYDFNDDWINRHLDLSSTSENVSNEIEVLKSYHLMREVVEELGIKTRRYYVNGMEKFESYQNFPVVIDTFQLTQSDTEEILISPINQEYFELKRKGETSTHQFGKLFNTPFGNFKIKKRGNEINLNSKYNYQFKLFTYDAIASKFQKKISVGFADLQKNSSVLNISIADKLVGRGKDILEKLIETYNEQKREKNDEIAMNTLNFIDDRLEEIGQELQAVESSVEQYKLRNDIAAESTSDLEILLREVSQLNTEQRQLMTDIRIVKSMKKEIENQKDGYNLIPLNLSLASPQIQDAIRPYNDLVLKRKQLLLTSQESNPVVIGVDQELDNLKTSINAAMENMEDDLQLALNLTNTQYNTLKNRISSVPRKDRVLTDKSRKQNITENLYIYLLEKREETALALVSNYQPNNIVDEPRKVGGSIAPNKLLIWFGSMLGGFSFPLLIIMGLEFFKDGIRDEKELKKAMPNVELIGHISQSRGKEKQVALRKKQTLAAEHFRSLRTNLQFQYRNKLKSILITSTTSNEGKTFIATNLAVSFALAKKNTIIIDFDLHKPEMANYLEEKINVGLSDFLCDNANLQDIIQESRVLPNLHYIASGPVLSSPSELLTEDKLANLFSYLKHHYEIIIMDTPPVGLISDAILLNNYVTNSLFVVRAGKTKKETIERAKEIIAKNLLVKPLLVLNGVRKSSSYQNAYKSYVN